MPKLKLKTRICVGCGKVDTGPSRYVNTKYCSRGCYAKYGAGQHLKTGRRVACLKCGKEVYRRGSHIKSGGKYCSLKCYHDHKRRDKRHCTTCEKSFQPKGATQKTCSYRCSKLGSNNPNYRAEDRWVGSDGYVCIKTDAGIKREHQYIAESVLGRKLKPDEIVHHIDEDKTNNRNDNLLIC